jgi:hypothetical protein
MNRGETDGRVLREQYVDHETANGGLVKNRPAPRDSVRARQPRRAR